MPWYDRLFRKDFNLTAPTSEFLRWLNGGSEESAHAITARSVVQWYGSRAEEPTSELQAHSGLECRLLLDNKR